MDEAYSAIGLTVTLLANQAVTTPFISIFPTPLYTDNNLPEISSTDLVHKTHLNIDSSNFRSVASSIANLDQLTQSTEVEQQPLIGQTFSYKSGQLSAILPYSKLFHCDYPYCY